MRKVKLGDKDIAEIFSGQAAPQKAECFSSEGIPFIRAGSLEFLCSGGSEDALELISESVAEEYHMRLFPVDTIVFAKSGMSAKIPRVYRLKKECYIVSHLAAVIPHTNLFPTYLEFYLSYNHPSSLISNDAYPSIRLSELENFEIRLPSLEKQKTIAEKLNAIEKNLYNKKQQLSTLDVLVKARFIEMFGDPVINPYQWVHSTLENFILFLTSGSRGWSQYFSNNGNIFITIKNIKQSKIDLHDVQYVSPPQNAEATRTKVKEGDLLISITADLGRTGVVSKSIAERGAYINQHIACVRLQKNSICPIFLSYYLESEAGKRQFSRKNQQAVKAGLNFNAIKSLEILLPPLTLQEEFAAFVEQVDKTKQIIRQSLEKLETLKKSLMQEYFG